jgi:hypothetical protein
MSILAPLRFASAALIFLSWPAFPSQRTVNCQGP